MFLFSLNSEPLCSTIFSSSSMSSFDRSADICLDRDQDDVVLVPGNAVCPTESMRGHACTARDVDELVVAHAALVGEERELRVALLAALADDLRVVVNVARSWRGRR